MFSKEEYWENRNAGRRGQGEQSIIEKIAKDDNGNLRTSDVTIIRVKNKNLAMNRSERRNMGIKVKKV